MNKDLFGKVSEEKSNAAKEELLAFDNGSFSDRLRRLNYVNTVFPFGKRAFSSDESFRIFDETIHCFIFGQFVATIILSLSFIERRIQEYFTMKGDDKTAKKSLSALLKEFEKNGFIDRLFIDKIDALRLKRNPFVHHRDIKEPHSLRNRANSAEIEFDSLLEKDAKEALTLMLAISRFRAF